MSVMGHQTRFRLLAFAAALIYVVILPPRAVQGQDKGAPPWGEFLRQFKRDRLLKKPFHMDPEEGVKGLAAKIRARELDIPNRKRAIRYLKELDCRQFPEAKAMLLGLLNPEEEKWEEVRYEAAMGLRDMLTRHSCNPNAAANAKKKQKEEKSYASAAWDQCCQTADACSRAVRRDTTPPDPDCHCKSCCDAETLNTLARTAYEMKEDGCCYEPSLRVRQMAVEAIQACGIPCNYAPYYAEGGEEPGPPPFDENTPKTPGRGKGEEAPPATDESAPAKSGDNTTEFRLQAVPSFTSASQISRLSNLCVVSLKHGQQIPPREEFSASYRGRIYHFASDSAREEFNASPDEFAVSFGGCDPVHFVETREAVEGRFLTQHDGRFYMFLNRQNLDQFKSNPDRYTGSTRKSSQVAAK